MDWKPYLKRALARRGFELRRITNIPGKFPYLDMRRFTGDGPLVAFDVGANIGQTIEELRRTFGDLEIHAFEPGPTAFKELSRRKKGTPRVHLNNCAVGSAKGTLELIENTETVMSSFLEPGKDGWGSVRNRVPVPVTTIDDYCAEHGITSIDILKSDTQGFDLEVLKGAEGLIRRHAIQLVFMEITMAELYKGLPDLHEVYGFMRQRGFELVSFYQIFYKHDRAAWTDALFIDPAYVARKGDAKTPPAGTAH